MKTKFPWWKWFAVWGVFLVLHFLYKVIPHPITLIFSEQTEATVTHMKIAFWAYLFASLIEYGLRRRQIASVEQFIYTRLFIAVAYPWLVITVWHTALSLGIEFPKIWEIIYANITFVIGVYIALLLEEILDAVAAYNPAFKSVVIMLLLLAMLTYTSFTLKAPHGPTSYFYWGP
jgi:hypothetical protein